MRRRPAPAARIFLIVILVVCLFGGFALYKRFSPSREMADLNQVYDVSGDQAALVVNGELSLYKGVLSGGTVYLDLDTVRSLLNSGFYWDKESGQLLYTNALSTYAAKIGGNACGEMGGEPRMMAHTIAYENGEALYVSAEYVALFTDMDYSIDEEPARLVVSLGNEERTRAIVGKDTAIRRLGGIKSEIIRKVPAGTPVTVLYEMENWSEVCTDDGYMGYIRNKALEGYTKDVRESSFSEPEYTSISFDHKITLVWHQVFEAGDNEKLSELIGQTQGVTVVSPTWFALDQNDGTFTSIADASYVEQAHDMGIDVWVLINDFNHEISIQQVLASGTSRNHLRQELVRQVKELGADGINIDFEYITQACAADYIQFLRELSVDCRRESLVLSIDNYMPTGGNAFYDMETQGKIADYVVLMGYDEHWDGSEAGSGASISFVDRGISTSLQMVPAGKLIGGVPFFTRIWTETPEEQALPGAEIREDGNSIYERYALSSEACGMERAFRVLEENGAVPEWNAELGQYYGEYQTEQGRVRIWLEDEKSLEEKLKLISQNQLAGVACWKLGLETGGVWPVISQYNQ